MRVRTNEHTIKKVRNLVNTFDQLGKKLPAFTSKTKRPASSDGSQPGPSVYLISHHQSETIKRIAKRVRDRSNELNILMSSPRSLHVISSIDTVSTIPTTGEWLILPQLRSICDQGLMNSCGVAGRVQLGCGLIKGLCFRPPL